MKKPSIYQYKTILANFLILIYLASYLANAAKGAVSVIAEDLGNVDTIERIWYVKKGSTGTGSSWQDALGEVSAAIKAARDYETELIFSGHTLKQEIWVSQGIYHPTEQMEVDAQGSVTMVSGKPRMATFFLGNFKMYGGFAGSETNISQRNYKNNPTILSGEINADPNQWSIHVVVAINGMLDGFVIEKGNANLVGAEYSDYHSRGGGIYVEYGGLQFNNLIIRNNYATKNGGGVWLGGIVQGEFNDIEIVENTSSGNGAAMYLGGEVTYKNLKVMGNRIINNDAASSSIIFNSGKNIFVNSLFVNNEPYKGWLYYTGSQSMGHFVNCTIANNQNKGLGSPTSEFYYQPFDFYNTVVLDSNYFGGFQDTFTAKNSLVRGYTKSDDKGNIDGKNIDLSNLFNSDDPSSTNFFVPTLNKALSNAGTNTLPKIGEGSNAISALPDKDLAGNPRIFDQKVDIGAFENQQLAMPVGEILYVKKGGGGNGSSWESAMSELGEALKFARSNNFVKQIWVAKGTYYPTEQWDAKTNSLVTGDSKKYTFRINGGLKVYGGFAGTEALLSERNIVSNETILNGDRGSSDTNTWSYHVVILNNVTSATVLDGFTIIHGNPVVPVNSDKHYDYLGGGILVADSSPKLENLLIKENRGISASGMGFINSSPECINLVISDNVAGSWIVSFSNSSPTFNKVVVKKNQTLYENTDILHFYSNSVVTFTNGLFVDNHNIGGALFNGVYSMAKNSIVLINSTVIHSTSIINWELQILSHNSVIIGEMEEGRVMSRYSFISGRDNSNWPGPNGGGNVPSTGVTLMDLFEGTNENEPGYFIPRANSVLVNAGSIVDENNRPLVLPATDLAGNPRIFEQKVDIGAFESQLPFVGIRSHLYVKKGGTGNGASWNTAMGELGDALRFAGENKGLWTEEKPLSIFVSKGTYKPLYGPDQDNFGQNVGRKNAFALVNNVHLYGGFDPDNGVTDTTHVRIFDEQNGSILSGDVNGDDVVVGSGQSLSLANISENNYNVVVANGGINNVYFDGFTIKRGNANGGLPDTNDEMYHRITTAGGVSIKFASPDLKNINILDNFGLMAGGAFFQDTQSKMSNINIHHNSGDEVGGLAIFDDMSSLPVLKTIQVLDNKGGTSGGMALGMAHAIINGAIIKGNWGGDGVGGLDSGDGNVTVLNAVISNNGAGSGNSASGIQSGLGSLKLSSSLVVGNLGGNASIYNTGDAASFKIYNSVVLGNYLGVLGGFDIKYSIVQGKVADPANHVPDGNVDPNDVFNNFTNGDYTLKIPGATTRALVDNPAINAGNNSLYDVSLGITDAAGNPRIRDNYIDLGAFEIQTGNDILPLKLVSFKAKVEQTSIQLLWETTEELNTSHFDIERGVSAKSLTKVGTVLANETGAHRYTFDDPQSGLVAQLVYYRLKMVDLDGTFAYSRIIKVNGKEGLRTLMAYPNPIASENSVTVVSGSVVKANLQDQLGRSLRSLQLGIGENKVELPKLGSGLYVISTEDGQSIKLIVK